MRISSELRERIYTTVHADSEGSSSVVEDIVVADYGKGRGYVKDEHGIFHYVTDLPSREISVTRTAAEWKALLTPEAWQELFGS